ncbi:MAG: hypothetical protein GX279_01885 [Clostridiaceae bacterium]|jgi:predicted RNase H-related nuclease YkuK (DUF458 family)|nr:hypothetical protein [Clostridiaceae bacterium]
MLLGNSLVIDNNTLFQNLKKEDMTFEEVYSQIIRFIEADTDSSYRISVGTDSQVGSKTVFASCILIHRIGKGAIGFLHKYDMQRPVTNLREKIYLETCASIQLAYLFDEERMKRIHQALGADHLLEGITFEFHIDIGTRGKTKSLINDMVGMVRGLNFIPRIKPDSYCASTFADKYTKAM